MLIECQRIAQSLLVGAAAHVLEHGIAIVQIVYGILIIHHLSVIVMPWDNDI